MRFKILLLFQISSLLIGSAISRVSVDDFLLFIRSPSLCPRLGAESSHLSEAPRQNLSDERPEKLPTFLPKENLNETTAPPTANETNATIAEELPLPDEQVETPKQPIATFDEWTKEKLRKEQEHRRTEQLVVNTPTNAQTTTMTDSTANPAAASRNYASRECGAKILHSNPEAENVKAILNDKEKDEYMKNPCERAQNKFFIVELCETIQPLTIELGNFELFSSGPREIRISAAERYPASEWTVLDEAVAQDSRTLQAFQLPKRGIYAKFLRVELLSHYGKEHFCTLTMIRVLGMSMVDEYEAEAEIAAGRLPPAVAAPNVVDVPKQTSSDTAAHEVPVSVVPPVAAQEVIKDPSSDAQQNTKKIFVQPSSDDKSNESLVGNKGYLRKIVDSVLEKFSPDAKKKHEFSRLNVFDTCVMCPVTGSADFRTKYFCALLRHQFQKSEDKSSDAPTVERPSRHSRYRESKRRQLQFLRRFHQNSMADFVLTQAIQNDSGQVPTATTDFTQAERPAKAEKIVNEMKTKKVEEKEFKDKIVEPETQTKEQPAAQGQPHQTVQSNTPAQPGKPAEAQQPNQPQQAKQQPAQPNNKPPPTNGQNGKNGNVEQPFADALPGPATSHKETVFMKLNKRIAALELNMSLSSEYLSELSRQYVAQAEMQEKNIERAKRVAEDAAQSAAAYINVTLDEQMKAIRREIAHFSDILAEMRNESHYLHAKLTIYRRPQPDRCHVVFPEYLKPQSASELSRYHYDLGNDEKTWTDMEVAYAVLAVQVFTVIFVVVIQKICAGGPYADEAVEPPPGPPPLTIEDVQKLIDERIAALNNSTNAPETKINHDAEEAPHNPDSKQKKRRRKKNNGKRMKESNIDCHTMSIDADNHTSELEDAEVAGIMSGFAPPLSSTNNTTSGRGSVDDIEYLGAGTSSRCASAPLHSANSPQHSRVPDGDLFYYTMAEQRRRQRQLELDTSGDALHVTPHYSSHRPITPPNVALGSHRGGFRRPNKN